MTGRILCRSAFLNLVTGPAMNKTRLADASPLLRAVARLQLLRTTELRPRSVGQNQLHLLLALTSAPQLAS